jgi:hypothetical protein
MRFSTHTLFAWLPLAILFTLVCGVVYISVHQNFRSSANDPQIQMAEDAAEALEKGVAIVTILGNSKVEIEKSLAPYLVMYDQAGKPVAGSGELNGKLPTLPEGVFKYAKNKGEDRITWQPEKGIRSAIVVVSYNSPNAQGGFVMAGRSLREVEKREHQLTVRVALLWIISLGILWGLVNFLSFMGKKMGEK